MATLNKLNVENKALVKMMGTINPVEVKELKKLLKDKAATESAIADMVTVIRKADTGSFDEIKCWDLVTKLTEEVKLNVYRIDEWLLLAKMKVAEHLLTDLSGKETHVDTLGNVSNDETLAKEIDWITNSLEGLNKHGVKAEPKVETGTEVRVEDLL